MSLADSFLLTLFFVILQHSVLHRYPVVTPDPEPWETEMANVQNKIGLAQREVRAAVNIL